MTNSIEAFAAHLAQAERSPLTIVNYRCDLRAFAAWFAETNGETFEPAKITPTDLRVKAGLSRDSEPGLSLEVSTLPEVGSPDEMCHPRILRAFSGTSPAPL